MKQNTIRRFISLAMLFVLVILFSATSDYFLQAKNIISIFRDASVIGIVGIGVTYVIITGGIELSTGSALALVGMVMANIYRYTTIPIWLMLAAGIVVGLAAGWFNGFIITRFCLPEFIATLSTLSIYRALTYVIAIKENGIITSQPMKDYRFTVFGGSVGGIYYVTIAFFVLAVIGQVILKKTRFGTNLYAVGSNKKAAELSGIHTDRTRMAAFVIVGFCVAVGSIFTTSRLQSTTAVLSIYRALTYVIAIKENGIITSQPMKDYRFTVFGGSVGGIYYVTIAFFVLAVIGQVILKKTRFGTNLYAVGSNKKAAELSGIHTDRTRMAAFVIVGFCVAVGSIFTTSRLQSTTAVLGTGLEFNVIAAVVVGGCALDGGRGDVIGTVIGALFMSVLDNGIYKYQINTAYQPIIKGAIIILVVVFDAWYNKRMEQASKNRKRLCEEVTAS